jgi:hypothetical protein
MAERGHHLSEFGHRDLLAAEVVDPAQQRNASGHASIIAERKTHPPVTWAFVVERVPPSSPRDQLGNLNETRRHVV